MEVMKESSYGTQDGVVGSKGDGHALSKGVSFGGLDEDGSMVVVDVSDIRE